MVSAAAKAAAATTTASSSNNSGVELNTQSRGGNDSGALGLDLTSRETNGSATVDEGGGSGGSSGSGTHLTWKWRFRGRFVVFLPLWGASAACRLAI